MIAKREIKELYWTSQANYEVALSYLDGEVSRVLASYARTVIESEFPSTSRSGGRANVRAAARAATERLAERVGKAAHTPNRKAAKELALHLDENRQIERNRRLMQRVAYEWRDGMRLQGTQAQRLMNLLGQLDARAFARCKAITIDQKKEQAALRFRSHPSEWTQIANGWEIAGLLRGPKPRSAPGQFVEILVEHKGAALLPKDPLPRWAFNAIARFRVWAEKCGHAPDVVDTAISRFLGPFCADHRTMGYARGWAELTKKEQRKAVRAGLDVERAWLGTQPTAHRMRADADSASLAEQRALLPPSKKPGNNAAIYG